MTKRKKMKPYLKTDIACTAVELSASAELDDGYNVVLLHTLCPVPRELTPKQRRFKVVLVNKIIVLLNMVGVRLHGQYKRLTNCGLRNADYGRTGYKTQTRE